jgi:hypothetical protein
MGSVSRAGFRVVLAAVSALVLASCGTSEPEVEGASPDMRRLTDAQYRNIIADVFGPQILVPGESHPPVRTDGLLAVGTRTSRITPSGFEEYYSRARLIAQQVVSPENRDVAFPCKPASVSAADDACARQFFSEAGLLLFRRPLNEKELTTAVEVSREGAKLGGFYDGVAVGLIGLLTAPQFLFVIDETEPDPDRKGEKRLTAYAKASRLSFLLWNSTPDRALLAASADGSLHTRAGLERQVDRMMASPRLETGMRAFFDDFLHFDRFETLEKDAVIYPAFTAEVIEDAREQVLRTLVSHVVVENRDYRDVFTTTKTFMTGPLARVYRVPLARPPGVDRAWVPYEFTPDDHRAGIVSQIGFVALASHPGISSPTLRGVAIRDHLLCQKVPDPPGDVDFSLFEDPDSGLKTARDRLEAHRTAPACAGCHKITDPIGLALEHFDGAGQFRTTENGAPIDTSGDLDGVPFNDAIGLGKALRESPAAMSCVVGRLASYALGRSMTRNERPFVQYLEETFANDGYRFLDLVRTVAMSNALYKVKESKQ